MKILYFYQFFSTPKGSWGTRVYEFASEWIKQGHEVTVVTSRFAKSDIVPKRFIDVQYIEGIKVIIFNIQTSNKDSIAKRILGFALFSLLSIYYAITYSCDVIVSSSGPITVGIPGLFGKFFRRRKLVLEVRDMWPDGAVQLNVIKNKTIIKLSYWLEKLLYKSSDLIVGLSPGMQQEIQKKSSDDKRVISVTNAANLKLFANQYEPPKQHTPFTYAIYTGNIGQVNNSLWVYEAAKILQDNGRSDISILMVGDGQLREEISRRKDEERVETLKLIDLMPKSDLVPLIQHAMVSLVPLKGTPILDTSSPNKFFESLAAGTPIIQNTNGWMKEYLDEHQVGFTCDPDDPQELADLLIKIRDKTLDTTDMRTRAKELAMQDFDKEKLAEKMLNAILEI